MDHDHMNSFEEYKAKNKLDTIIWIPKIFTPTVKKNFIAALCRERNGDNCVDIIIFYWERKIHQRVLPKKR